MCLVPWLIDLGPFVICNHKCSSSQWVLWVLLLNYWTLVWFWEPSELAYVVNSEDSLGSSNLAVWLTLGNICTGQFPKEQCARVKEEIRKIKLVKNSKDKNKCYWDLMESYLFGAVEKKIRKGNIIVRVTTLKFVWYWRINLPVELFKIDLSDLLLRSGDVLCELENTFPLVI